MSEEIKVDDTVDVTDVKCPTEILKLDDNQDGTFTLFVKKVGD